MADLSSRVHDVFFSNPVLTAAGPNVGTAVRLQEAVAGGSRRNRHKNGSVVPAKDPSPPYEKPHAAAF